MEPQKAATGPRACVACAQSKARCIFTDATTATNGKCGRCNRLNKECILQTPAIRTRKPKKVTRVAQLEERLENLVSRLNPPQEPLPINFPDLSSGLALDGSYESMRLVPPSVSPSNQFISASPSSPYGNTPASNQSNQYAPTPESTSSYGKPVQGINLRDPDAMLNLFRNQLSDQFPFIIIPPGVKAHDLSYDRPFLLKVIVMVASAQDVKAQASKAEEIVEYLNLHLLLRSEKNFDLLQGLLLFAAWFHCHVHLGRRLIILLHLAEALVVELRLNKEPLQGMSREEKQREFWLFADERLESNSRTLEERRAFLGLLYLQSIVSVYIERTEPTQYAKYAEDCRLILEECSEYPSDQLLIQFMKLQSIAQDIRQTLPLEALMLSSVSAPVAACIKTLQSKLKKFQERLPSQYQQNPFLLTHYHSILVCLTETALLTPSLPSRAATLHACLSSAVSFFSALFSIPPIEYYKAAYSTWVQMNYSLTVLSKLSLFESDDWDLSHVGAVVDLSLVLEGLIGKFEEVKSIRRQLASSHVDSESDTMKGDGLFAKLIPGLKQYKAAFEARRGAIMRGIKSGPLQPHTMTTPNLTMSHPDMMSSSAMSDMILEPLPDFDHFDIPDANFSQLDDAFWQEFMGDYGMMPMQSY